MLVKKIYIFILFSHNCRYNYVHYTNVTILIMNGNKLLNLNYCTFCESS